LELEIKAKPQWQISEQPVVGIDDGRENEAYYKTVGIDIPAMDGNQELPQGVIVSGSTQAMAVSRAKSICEAMNNKLNGWHPIDTLEKYKMVFLAVISETEKSVVVGYRVEGDGNPNCPEFVLNEFFKEVDHTRKVVAWLPHSYLPEIVDPDEAKEQLQKATAWNW